MASTSFHPNVLATPRIHPSLTQTLDQTDRLLKKIEGVSVQSIGQIELCREKIWSLSSAHTIENPEQVRRSVKQTLLTLLLSLSSTDANRLSADLPQNIAQLHSIIKISEIIHRTFGEFISEIRVPQVLGADSPASWQDLWLLWVIPAINDRFEDATKIVTLMAPEGGDKLVFRSIILALQGWMSDANTLLKQASKSERIFEQNLSLLQVHLETENGRDTLKSELIQGATTYLWMRLCHEHQFKRALKLAGTLIPSGPHRIAAFAQILILQGRLQEAKSLLAQPPFAQSPPVQLSLGYLEDAQSGGALLKEYEEQLMILHNGPSNRVLDSGP